jgi:sigma-E factor negative regulatory protein RseA
MTMEKMARERVSEFVDGEIESGNWDTAFMQLKDEEGKEIWELYHQIGDSLRSDDLDVPLSDDFMARMKARLDAEPAIVAPVLPAVQRTRPAIRRFALPGALAAAAAAVAFVATPQLIVAMHGGANAVPTSVAASSSGVARASMVSGARTDMAMREQDINEYLIAHQRFSPSVYSSAQFARSATFANDTGK